jgi:hypothetical protein
MSGTPRNPFRTRHAPERVYAGNARRKYRIPRRTRRQRNEQTLAQETKCQQAAKPGGETVGAGAARF